MTDQDKAQEFVNRVKRTAETLSMDSMQDLEQNPNFVEWGEVKFFASKLDPSIRACGIHLPRGMSAVAFGAELLEIALGLISGKGDQR